MPPITAPVGPNQPNRSADGTFVQQALARHARWLRGVAVRPVSGRFDAATAVAITKFQREAAALRIADGTVLSRGFTIAQLARDASPKPKHRIFLAMCWAHPNDMQSDADYAAAARRLSCEVAAIRAVVDTEAKDRMTFARRYNVPEFAHSDDDGKMRRAYGRLSPPLAGRRGTAPARAEAAR